MSDDEQNFSDDEEESIDDIDTDDDNDNDNDNDGDIEDEDDNDNDNNNNTNKLTGSIPGLPPLPPITITVGSPITLTQSPQQILPSATLPPKLVITQPGPVNKTKTTKSKTKTQPNQPPPIPAELIVPSTLIQLNQTTPVLVIQPAKSLGTPTNIEQVPTKLVITKPVSVQSEKKQPQVQKELSLDEMLVKSDTENNDIFTMRSVYSRLAMKIYNNQINPATAVLIGRLATNKAMFGVTYPEETDRLLIYINSQITL